MDGKEAADVVRDLLTIAKVAMPADLFAIDPRILNAQDLLASLERKPSSIDVLRVPAISKRARKPPYKGKSR